MGQLIGLSILLLVIYAIAASISKRNRSRIERLPHYNAADTHPLEHEINHLQSMLSQQWQVQQDQLQAVYQQGFKDGVAHQQIP